MEELMNAAEQIALFCRLNINTKKELPIRSSEMGLLIYLSKHKPKSTPIEASRFFNVSKGMITNMVTSLVKKEYLIKEKSLEDKRSHILIPTEKALYLVDETYDEYFNVILTLQTKLGIEEFNDFISKLERINTILLEEKNNG